MIYRHKDPDEIDDIAIRWELNTSETVASATWLASAGITVVQSSIDGNTCIARISGGQSGRRYELTCRVTTSAGRVLDQTASIICLPR